MAKQIALSELFAAIDAKDTDKFVSYLTEDAVFRYGSSEPVRGRQAVHDYVAGFFSTLEGLQHRLTANWESDGVLVCEGQVAYALPDGDQVTVPFVNVFGLRGDRIKEYKVYVDPTPLAR